eukprot:3029-Heterococcus_DN1.PRE.2
MKRDKQTLLARAHKLGLKAAIQHSRPPSSIGIFCDSCCYMLDAANGAAAIAFSSTAEITLESKWGR